MAFSAAEARIEERLDEFPRDGVTDNKAAEADHVKVVVFDALTRRKSLMDQTCPHTWHFVGDNARPNPTAANSHAAIDCSIGNCARQRLDKVWIVIIKGRLTVAEVDYFVAGIL
jgi:hypothetical protein